MVKVRARLGKSVYQDHLNVVRTGGGLGVVGEAISSNRRVTRRLLLRNERMTNDCPTCACAQWKDSGYTSLM